MQPYSVWSMRSSLQSPVQRCIAASSLSVLLSSHSLQADDLLHSFPDVAAAHHIQFCIRVNLCNNFFRQISNGNLTLCRYINLLSDGLIRLCDCYKSCCCIFHIIKISRWCQRTKFDLFFPRQKLSNNCWNYSSSRLSWSKRIKRPDNCNRKIKAAVKALCQTICPNFVAEYGDCPWNGCFSSIGTYCAVPYTSDVDVTIIFSVPKSLAACKTFNVPLILVST